MSLKPLIAGMSQSGPGGGGSVAVGDITGFGTGVKDGVLTRPIFATTVTAGASTLTLTVTSASTQEFTGSTYHSVGLPSVDTLVAGWATLFINKSTGAITIRPSNGSSVITFLSAGQSVSLVCNDIAGGNGAAAWDVVGLSPRLWLAAQKSGTQTLTDGSSDVATPFQTILGGTMQSAWNTTTGEFTAPINGLLKISGLAQGESAASGGGYQEGYYELRIKRSGSVIAYLVAVSPAFNDNSSYYSLNENPNSCVAVTGGDVLSVVSTWSENGVISLNLNVESQIQLEYLQ